MSASAPLRPADLCRGLLAALEAAEGRRKLRKRDQTPDTIGLAVRRELLERVAREDPAPEALEERLLAYVREAEARGVSGAASTAQAVLEDWRLAHAMPTFVAWLEEGAPSADANP